MWKKSISRMVFIAFVSFLMSSACWGIPSMQENLRSTSADQIVIHERLREIRMFFNRGDYMNSVALTLSLIDTYGYENVPEACDIYADSINRIMLNNLAAASSYCRKGKFELSLKILDYIEDFSKEYGYPLPPSFKKIKKEALTGLK